MSETYCCKMREKFVIGILADHPELPVPTDAVDFMDFDQSCGGKPVLRIKYCPFCGKQDGMGPLRPMTWTKENPE